MNKLDEQERRWNLLMDLDLYSVLENTKNDLKREILLAEFCEAYEISIEFARDKIAKIKKQKEQVEERTEDHDESER